MDCTLLFYYKPGQLNKDVNVVLTFDAPTKSELSTDQNYVAWNVAYLKSTPGSAASNSFSVDYTSRLGFSVAQLTNGNTVIPSSMIEMKNGQSTDLTLEGGNPTWSDPSGDTGTIIRATNKTGLAQNIAVGTVKDVPGGFTTLVPSFLWKVGENLTAEAKFQPILKMYVNLDYKQNDFMTGDLASITPIWTGNLAALAPLASFAFAETPQGGYAVTPIPSMLKMVSDIAAPPINVNFNCHLNWQATVGLAVVGVTFTAIAKICTDKGYTYTEVKNDKNLYRTIGVSKPEQSADDLHKIMMYVNLDYKQNDFMTGDLASITPIWTGNLAALAPLASFAFAETPQGGYAVTPIPSMLKMVSDIAAPPINVNFNCHLNWQATVGLAVVGVTFTAIAKICTDKGYTYTEVKNDKNLYRTIGVSKPEQSADDLHKIMVNAIIEAINKKSALAIGDESFSDEDIDKNWRITDETATNVSSEDHFGKEDVIAKGSAAWYHLK
ncbi:hypothetical protein PQX77_019705 [Marasmius sp. AFHP31]|nr:hypothetical protein PQX77_019705 [Marasmius sp. AFHP31]